MRNRENLFLIIDDEPDMCWALEHILKRNGLSSKRALSGQEALQMVKLHHFQFVFLDAKLPDMDGLQLARLIKAADPNIRIMMLSGYFYTDDMTVQRAIAEGLICGFISKPFIHSEITKVVECLTQS